MDTLQYFNDDDAERISLYRKLLGFFNENPAIIAQYPDLQTAIEELRSVEGDLTAEAKDRNNFKLADRGVKPEEQDKIIHATFIAQRALRALGKAKRIAELLNLTMIPKTHMKKMRYSALKEYTGTILDLLNKYKVQMADSTYKQEDIDAFTAEVDIFSAILTKVDIDFEKSVDSTAKIAAKFKKGEAALSTIKDYVESLVDKHPDFYTLFKQMYTLRSYGVRHEKPEEGPDQPPSNPVTPQ